MNTALWEWSYKQKAIVCTVKCAQPHQSTAWQSFLQTGPLAFLPLGHPSQRYCSIVWSADNDYADKLMAVDDASFIHALNRVFEKHLGKTEHITQRYCFPLKQRHAVSYIAQQFALVGDAAHTIHPLAGQGPT